MTGPVAALERARGTEPIPVLRIFRSGRAQEAHQPLSVVFKSETRRPLLVHGLMAWPQQRFDLSRIRLQLAAPSVPC
jgi:hypothetical protein